MAKVSWRTKAHIRPDEILKKIDSSKSVMPDGRISFKAFDYHDGFASLFSLIKVSGADYELDLDAALTKTISIAAQAGRLNKDEFMQTLNGVCRDMLSKKRQAYQLVTSVSLDSSMVNGTALHVDGAIIRFQTRGLPSKYSERTKAIDKFGSELKNINDGYCYVTVGVESRSASGAVNHALRCLDVVRGVMALFSNSGMELFGGVSTPINKIRLGEAHTLHREDGSLEEHPIWLESPFEYAKPHVLRRKDVFTKNVKWALNRLNRSQYARELRNSIVRYVRAFDDPNYSSSLIQAWGAIEALASPGQANYDKVARRCAFLFEDAEYHLAVLGHLLERRNQTVHSGSHSDRAKTYCYQAQFYYKQLLLFHLRRPALFPTLDLANQFLDLPMSPDELRSKITQYKKALAFRESD